MLGNLCDEVPGAPERETKMSGGLRYPDLSFQYMTLSFHGEVVKQKDLKALKQKLHEAVLGF